MIKILYQVLSYNLDKNILVNNSKYFKSYIHFDKECNGIDTEVIDISNLNINSFMFDIMIEHWKGNDLEWNSIRNNLESFRIYKETEDYFCPINPTTIGEYYAISLYPNCIESHKRLRIGYLEYGLSPIMINYQLDKELVKDMNILPNSILIDYYCDIEPMKIPYSQSDIRIDLSFLYLM